MTIYNIIDQRFTQIGLIKTILKIINRVKSMLKIKTGKNEHGDTQRRPTIC